MRMAGRRVVITGAASGIGLATAGVLRREGAAVALLDRDLTRLEDAIESVRAVALSGQDDRSGATTPDRACVGIHVDVTDHAQMTIAVAQAADAIGGIDGLVSSAGMDCLVPFAQMTPQQWRQVIDVNLHGPFNLCQAALAHMRSSGPGTIVHIASGAALRPLAARTAYCTAKAGLVMFAKSLAVDLAPDSIRVNAVCPGIIDTPMFRQSLAGADDPGVELERIFDRYLIRRVGEPQDIANAVLYLSCAESAHVTGSALAVDGGRAFH